MIITVINQKGGTGKTTTAAALLSYYTAQGARALGIDLDPQSNLTLATGARNSAPSALGIITGEAATRDTIQRANFSDIVAGLLLTRHNARANISRDLRAVLEREAERLGTVVFDTAIRETVTIKQAQAMQEGIYQSDPNATTAGAADYLAFIKELEQVTAPANNRR